MSTNLLWYVLAGFLLGFATSTLWEWLHFRQVRLRRLEERTRSERAGLRSHEEGAPRSQVAPEPVWAGQAYRSPGVFLESEGAAASAPRRAEAPPAPEMPAPEMVEDDGPFVPPTVASVTAPRAGGLPPRRRQEQLLAELRRTSEVATTKSEPAFPRRKPPLPIPPAQNPAQNVETATGVVAGIGSGVAPATALSPDNPSATTPDATPLPVAPQPGTAPVSTAQGWRADPRLTQPSRDYPDDLSKIKGIGDVYRHRLFKAGYFTWHQIAEADTAKLRQATGAYPSSNVEEWPVQARALIAKHGRAGAVYTGPLPDELTKILGIGPVSAQTLYRAGICTFEQLASSSVEALAALFPIAVAGDQPDFQSWINQAARLADEKHRA